MQTPLGIDGLANARDLGGLERTDGSRTPAGVFIRAETLDRVPDAGWDRLRAHGVGTVVDLRRPSERTVSVPHDITVRYVDLDGDERHFWESREKDGQWGTPLYYVDHVRELPHRLAGALDEIARARTGGILFHCGAGWDRTGLLAAVLLKAVGVTEDAATRDYLSSFANAETMAELHSRSFDVAERLSVLDRFAHTPESAFRDMYRRLDLDAWLDAHADAATAEAVTTWRGAIPSAPTPPSERR
ncbi:tyrosine-protein phosphatase [Microbacterium sp. NPDC091382]|uniref:tyrosine-protein phosphatase n=1 Tax=Microbacterium sp. NPDC091382 TaxID=3364210 RepID=UPI003824DD01